MRSVAAIFLLVLACLEVTAQTRSLRPDDMFQLRRVGATAWAPNGQYASIEISKPSRWLDGVPANDLLLLDVKTRAVRPLSSRSSAYIGYFNAIWSPDSERVAFLSVDRNAVVRAWVWTVGTATASMVPNLEPRIGFNDPPIAWIDGDRLAVMSWEPDAVRSGILHVRVLRGRNAATAWQRASEGKTASVSVVESPARPETDGPGVELVTVDLSTRAQKRLARGRIHSLAVAPDGCCISFHRNQLGTVSSYFAAQVMRMLQTEKGAMGMSGPPWKEPDRYRENSAIYRADKVETPLLLIHGELDFIPIQQAEEFFTALFRQDKRVTLLRYAGEGHTIVDRTNVLDLWQRLEKWLADTMAPKSTTSR